MKAMPRCGRRRRSTDGVALVRLDRQRDRRPSLQTAPRPPVKRDPPRGDRRRIGRAGADRGGRPGDGRRRWREVVLARDLGRPVRVRVRHAWSRRTTTRANRTRPLNGIPSWADALIRISRSRAGCAPRTAARPSIARASSPWPRSIRVRAIRQERESNSPVDGRTRTRCCGSLGSPVGDLLNGGCDGPARPGSRTPLRRRAPPASRGACARSRPWPRSRPVRRWSCRTSPCWR